MWVYPISEVKSSVPELVQGESAASVEELPETAAVDVAPAETPVSIKREKHTKGHSAADCILLAASYLLGCAAAGWLQAICDARQLTVLNYYLSQWRGLFQVQDAQGAAILFAAEYGTLLGAATALLLFGLSALGPVLICFFTMLYGLGSGLLIVQLLPGTSPKTLLLFLLFTGIPAALAAGCLCLLGSSALQVSSKIRAWSLWHSIKGQSFCDVQTLFGQYIRTAVLLLPLCGAAVGLACLGSRL